MGTRKTVDAKAVMCLFGSFISALFLFTTIKTTVEQGASILFLVYFSMGFGYFCGKAEE